MAMIRNLTGTHFFGSFPGDASGKDSPAHAGGVRDTALIPGLGRSLEGGYGNPLQYFCLENPSDRGTWQSTVHRDAKSQT